MMQGHVEGGAVDPAPPRRYRVVPCDAGWAVAVNGAATRPLPDCVAAERLAARLQAEADRLDRNQHRGLR
ncbi:hypothetical protein [Brevundimonas sp.]|jgi:hypothetical protein|uniref:hypothetical protein n=1 Tax=Brevundimonas sp. TaxID=1871086 RepID=UPI0037C14DC1